MSVPALLTEALAELAKVEVKAHDPNAVAYLSAAKAKVREAKALAEPPVEPPPPAPPTVYAEETFSDGLVGWSLAGVGKVTPTVVTAPAGFSAAHAAYFALTGEQERTELILGGNGTGSLEGIIEFTEGTERTYSFETRVNAMAFGEPGKHNTPWQLKGAGEGSPALSLCYWDSDGHTGIFVEKPWGTRNEYLAPLVLNERHLFEISFLVHPTAGAYEITLDGERIAVAEGVETIVPGVSYVYIKNGLYRAASLTGLSELFIGACKLTA